MLAVYGCQGVGWDAPSYTSVDDISPSEGGGEGGGDDASCCSFLARDGSVGGGGGGGLILEHSLELHLASTSSTNVSGPAARTASAHSVEGDVIETGRE